MHADFNVFAGFNDEEFIQDKARLAGHFAKLEIYGLFLDVTMLRKTMA